MRKIKVLQYIGSMDRAGAETFLMNVFRKIDKKKFEFYFLVYGEKKFDYSEEILNLGGKFIYIKEPKMREILSFKKTFRELIDKNGNFDVIHCHVNLLNGFILKEAYRCKIPIRISHSHSSNDLKRKSIKRFIYKVYSRMLIDKYSNKRLACSNDAGIFLYKKKFEIVNNAIDFNMFKKSEKNIRKEFNIKNNEKIIVQIGTLKDIKNHIFSIKIVEELLKINKNFKFFIVGEGERLENLSRYVTEKKLKNNILFLGKRDDINDILINSDLLIMPSIREGIPLTLIEGQATGIKILASSNISKECDLGLGLIDFLSIDDIELWKNKILQMNFIKKKNNMIKDIIIDKGYSIESVCKYIESIYGEEFYGKRKA